MSSNSRCSLTSSSSLMSSRARSLLRAFLFARMSSSSFNRAVLRPRYAHTEGGRRALPGELRHTRLIAEELGDSNDHTAHRDAAVGEARARPPEELHPDLARAGLVDADRAAVPGAIPQ